MNKYNKITYVNKSWKNSELKILTVLLAILNNCSHNRERSTF